MPTGGVKIGHPLGSLVGNAHALHIELYFAPGATLFESRKQRLLSRMTMQRFLEHRHKFRVERQHVLATVL